jgi:hypothetical protein
MIHPKILEIINFNTVVCIIAILQYGLFLSSLSTHIDPPVGAGDGNMQRAGCLRKERFI